MQRINSDNCLIENFNKEIKKIGSLKLVIGPMYAGKSTELIRYYRLYKFLNKKILCFNHNINKRYNSSNIITHDKDEITKCFNIGLIEDIYTKYNEVYKDADVIIIEELQFFKDAYENIIKMVEKDNKIVIAAGLIGDYKRNPFGDILKLIPIADEVKTLKALCSICKDGTKGHFTKRITSNDELFCVGSHGSYISVCRYHYFN